MWSWNGSSRIPKCADTSMASRPPAWSTGSPGTGYNSFCLICFPSCCRFYPPPNIWCCNITCFIFLRRRWICGTSNSELVQMCTAKCKPGRDDPSTTGCSWFSGDDAQCVLPAVTTCSSIVRLCFNSSWGSFLDTRKLRPFWKLRCWCSVWLKRWGLHIIVEVHDIFCFSPKSTQFFIGRFLRKSDYIVFTCRFFYVLLFIGRFSDNIVFRCVGLFIYLFYFFFFCLFVCL